MTGEKPCKVCNLSRLKSYGIAVRSLEDLKTKGRETLGMDSKVLVSVVLEEDGTIVEDEAYFMCLPPNTKFMILHSKERWGPAMRVCFNHIKELLQKPLGDNKPVLLKCKYGMLRSLTLHWCTGILGNDLIEANRTFLFLLAVDGGTAWLGESIEIDELDSAFTGTESWRGLAQQLKQDLSSIIMMSEEELQCLVDVSCEELAKELGHRETKVQSLQDTLQRVLDQREEERQSREILQLYLQAAEKESNPTSRGSSQEGEEIPRVPFQTALLVVNEGLQNLSAALSWDAEKTKDLLQACEEELEKRLNKVQALQSLRNCTQGAEEEGNRPAKCRKKAPFQS
ncbi:UNVERIFIED_CONTAM: hypothetical protein FKN15_011113 [Acipenser sinensis]